MKSNQFKLYLQEIKEFTQKILTPYEQKIEETSKIPDEVIEKIKKIGLFSISIPK
ncbi:uncharacterized protein METZ01_LOCUS498577, partial [marine metagenome]